MREDKPKVEDDQVIIDAQTPEAEDKAELIAEIEAKEASENCEGTFADDEEIYQEDEEYDDEEYFKVLTEEVVEQLANKRREEMAKFESGLKTNKTKVKFGNFNEVEAMVLTLPLFFEALLG